MAKIISMNRNKMRKFAVLVVVAYFILKFMKKLYIRYYDKVKYITLKQILSLNKKYDFIIVGSGTSGSCVAGLLARDHRKPKVLLIEAGCADSFHPLSTEVIPLTVIENQQTIKDWQYKTDRQKYCGNGFNNKQSSWPRGKIIGGSSILNYMMYVRGNKHDYNLWANEYECKGWDYDSILPIFKSLENCSFKHKNKDDIKYRGFDGLQTLYKASDEQQKKLSKLFVSAAINAGYKFNDDYNGESQNGVSFTQFNTNKYGRRITSFRAFVASLFEERNKYSNIDVLHSCQVTKILCRNNENDKTNVAIGVEIDQKHQIFINEQNGVEIIVSAGAVGSPHLLLLSGIGDKEHLNEYKIDCVADLPGVGQNLRDHIGQYLNVTIPKEQLPDLSTFKGLLLPYIFHGKGPLTTSTLDVTLFCKSSVAKRNKSKTNDIQIICAVQPYGKTEKESETMQNEIHEKYFNVNTSNYPLFSHKRKHNAKIQYVFGMMLVNNQTKSVGYIKLQSNNPYAYPEIQPNYLSNEEDLEALIDGFIKMEEIIKQEPFKSLGCKIVEYEKFNSIKEYAEYIVQSNPMTIYHPIGTCKMGNVMKDEMVVCDERLKVSTFKNLRVADASIAPYLPSGNTQAMCYLIGCKAAKMILEDWKPINI